MINGWGKIYICFICNCIRKREQFRLEVLKKCEKELGRAAAIQLGYDGKIINKMDRYIGAIRKEKGTFEKERSVTAESSLMPSQNMWIKVYSVMSDTTALNTGKIFGVNKRLTDFYKLHHDCNIHSLDCLFQVNEIYFTHAIAKIEGKKKKPGTMEHGLLMMKYFGDFRKPDMSKLVDREKPVVPVTKMASLHLRKKIEEHSFRNDHMCLLALFCYILMKFQKI